MAKENKKNLNKKKNVSSKSKTSTTKKVVRKSNVNSGKKVNINKKQSKPIKPEKWYVWLKNNILENEEKYSKKYKNRRLLVSLFAVFCFFAVLFSVFIIDFSNSIKNNKVPYFSIQKRNEYKQVTLYYGLFYKAWRCDNGNTALTYGKYNDDIGYCDIVPKYDENGVFVNPNKVKMTQSQINIIKTYYFDNYIYFKSEKELVDAYKLSSALNKILWINGKQDGIINNDETVELAIFGKVENKDGVDSFSFQFNDPYYHECVKKLNGEYLVSNYNYSTNTCGASWETLSIDKDTCKIAKNSTEFIQNLAPIIDYCK